MAAAAARRTELLRAAQRKFATLVSPTSSSSSSNSSSLASVLRLQWGAAGSSLPVAAAFERERGGDAVTPMPGHSRASSSGMPETEVPEPGNLSEHSHEDASTNPVAAARAARFSSPLNLSSPLPSWRSPLSVVAAAAAVAEAAEAAATAPEVSDEDSDSLALVAALVAALGASGKSHGGGECEATADLGHPSSALAGALRGRALAAQTFARVLVEEQAVLSASAAQQTLAAVRRNPAASVKGQLLLEYRRAHVVLLERV
jgi:hypothetical protein